jgi:hypothetical protein
MQAIAPDKMTAMCEGAAIPSPDADLGDGARWLYALPWFAGGKANPPAWIRSTFGHPSMVTLDELPSLVPHNVAPRIRLIQPRDGDVLDADPGEIEAVVSDPDGNARDVAFAFIPAPLRDWSLMDDADVLAAAREAYPAGEGVPDGDGRVRVSWPAGPSGLYAVVALATDADGAVSVSNIARVSRGTEEYARGRPVTASSDADNAAKAVDGDYFTVWNGNREEPQQLTIDLGEDRTVGAVTVSWTKAYAEEFRVSLSLNGEGWTDILHRTDKRGFRGDADIIRCPPLSARYVRLETVRPGTSWGGYGVADIRVYRELPVLPAAGPPIEIRLVALPGEAGDGIEFPQVGAAGPVRLEGRVSLGREHVADASVSRRDDRDGPRVGVGIRFTPEGAVRFAELTEANVGRSLAIVVGGRVVCAPVIRGPIRGGRAEISGSFSVEEAEQMVETILGDREPGEDR